MNGHTSPGSAFFTHGSGMPPAGGEISKSTQNLISAMEEMPADWERASLRPPSQAFFKQSPQNGSAFTAPGGFSNSSLVADEESQEFDDLIFALKTVANQMFLLPLNAYIQDMETFPVLALQKLVFR
ncbi:UNVERIFIED_CONTAM: G-protein coupled receptor 98 [Gekko kuhli]